MMMERGQGEAREDTQALREQLVDALRERGQPSRDRPPRLTRGPAQRDFFPLDERQIPARKPAPLPGPHAANSHDPPVALDPVRARLRGGVSDELPSLQSGQNGCTRSGTIRSANTTTVNTPAIIRGVATTA